MVYHITAEFTMTDADMSSIWRGRIVASSLSKAVLSIVDAFIDGGYDTGSYRVEETGQSMVLRRMEDGKPVVRKPKLFEGIQDSR